MKRAILPTALLLLLAATTVLAAPPDPPASVWFYDGFETYTLVDGGGYFTRLANCAPNWGGMTNTEWGGPGAPVWPACPCATSCPRPIAPSTPAPATSM